MKAHGRIQSVAALVGVLGAVGVGWGAVHAADAWRTPAPLASQAPPLPLPALDKLIARLAAEARAATTAP